LKDPFAEWEGMDRLLTVEHLSKCFGNHRVIDNLSFTLDAGNRVTLFAPSGSGKTTLINILNGFDTDYQGQYALTAKSPAIIFQEPRLFSHLNVQENILFPFLIKRRRLTVDIHRRLQRWLEVCQITDKLDAFPFTLSGGSKQKVALIRGLLDFPDLVMMDEPFKSIDIASKTAIISHIVDTLSDMTVLLVTHNLEEIPLLSKSLMVFKKKSSADYVFYPDVSSSPALMLLPQVIASLLS